MISEDISEDQENDLELPRFRWKRYWYFSKFQSLRRDHHQYRSKTAAVAGAVKHQKIQKSEVTTIALFSESALKNAQPNIVY